ncbi:MAG: hypothetical protein QOE92_1918 [Chloroflexota bacterium]|jgi:hypothetical protein|nr:hypothetical protein [Chloroflexota bacterium]
MFLLPALTCVISLVFAAQVLNQFRVRGRSHQLAWGLALLFYGLAAVPEVLGSLYGWNELEYRAYYLLGGVLLVPWLALGTSELLLTPTMPRARLLYRLFVAAVSLVGLAAVLLAPLHAGHLADLHAPGNCTMWCSPASESGYTLANGLAALSAAAGNILGTLVLAIGAGLSAYRTYRAGLPRHLPVGNLLILVGALIPAAVASLTRLGNYEFFYAAQALGIAIIFAGFLAIAAATQARRQVA